MEQKIQTCTRPEPHICTVNGPCNGWPNIKERAAIMEKHLRINYGITTDKPKPRLTRRDVIAIALAYTVSIGFLLLVAVQIIRGKR